MKKILAIVIVATLLLASAAWTHSVKGSGVAATDARSAAGAHAVNVKGSIDTTVKLGDAQTVVLHGDDNVLPLITTEVKDGTLVISSHESWSSRLDLHADVTLRRCDAVALEGSGNVSAQASKGDFAVDLSGSGNADVSGLDAPRVRVALAGSGNVTLAGRCDSLSESTSGSGNFDADDLACADVAVSIAGSGNADVHASRALNATIAGSGNVRYAGAPKVTQVVQGSGGVRAR